MCSSRESLSFFFFPPPQIYNPRSSSSAEAAKAEAEAARSLELLSDLFVYVRPSPLFPFLIRSAHSFPPTVISAGCKTKRETSISHSSSLLLLRHLHKQWTTGMEGRKRKRRDELEEAHTYSPFPSDNRDAAFFSKINSIISHTNVHPKSGGPLFPFLRVTHPEEKTKTPPSPPLHHSLLRRLSFSHSINAISFSSSSSYNSHSRST